MTTRLTPELYWLAATAMLTAVMWVPYILQLIAQMGPVAAFWDPYHETPHEAAWARRAKRAHANAVENLAVFSALVLCVQLLSVASPITSVACAVYFFARAAHYIAYVTAVPLVRSLLFLIGFGCQVVLGATVLGWLL